MNAVLETRYQVHFPFQLELVVLKLKSLIYQTILQSFVHVSSLYHIIGITMPYKIFVRGSSFLSKEDIIN